MEKHRVTVDPVSIMLEPLREVWQADKSKMKDEAIKMLSYIHLCAQIDSNAPFYKAPPDDVSALVKKDIYGDYEHVFKGEFDEEWVEQAVFHYREAYETPEQTSARAIEKKIHQINSTLQNTDIIIKEVVIKGATQFISNFPILNKMMQDLTKINAAKQAVMNIVKGQQAKTMKAGREMSYLEKKRAELKTVKDKKQKDVQAPMVPILDGNEENF